MCDLEIYIYKKVCELFRNGYNCLVYQKQATDNIIITDNWISISKIQVSNLVFQYVKYPNLRDVEDKLDKFKCFWCQYLLLFHLRCQQQEQV